MQGVRHQLKLDQIKLTILELYTCNLSDFVLENNKMGVSLKLEALFGFLFLTYV